LIFKDFSRRAFSGHSRQALDLSGFGGDGGAAINKVIHTKSEAAPKCFQIKDLSRVLQIDLKTIR